MRIAKIVKWGLIGIVCIGAALLAVRAYRALSGPSLQPWHTFVPAELRAADLDAAGLDERITSFLAGRA